METVCLSLQNLILVYSPCSKTSYLMDSEDHHRAYRIEPDDDPDDVLAWENGSAFRNWAQSLLDCYPFDVSLECVKTELELVRCTLVPIQLL